MVLFRSFVDERMFDNNEGWKVGFFSPPLVFRVERLNHFQDQWLSDQIWSQTMHELNRGGMQNAWPAWAGQMIDDSHLPGHVDLPAP